MRRPEILLIVSISKVTAQNKILFPGMLNRHGNGVICIPVGSIEPSASVYDYQLEFFHVIYPF